MIFNIVSNIVNDNHCKKGLDYIECKVNEIMKILKT